MAKATPANSGEKDQGKVQGQNQRNEPVGERTKVDGKEAIVQKLGSGTVRTDFVK